jgi:hypothetical protein
MVVSCSVSKGVFGFSTVSLMGVSKARGTLFWGPGLFQRETRLFAKSCGTLVKVLSTHPREKVLGLCRHFGAVHLSLGPLSLAKDTFEGKKGWGEVGSSGCHAASQDS